MRKYQLLTSAVAVLALGALALPATADARGVHIRAVRLEDRCDPASFNLAIPQPPDSPPTCIPHGGETITFATFLQTLNPTDFGNPKWRNHPDELDLRSGDQISVTVRGGEGHSFTEVSEFGAGCVPPINDALQLGAGPSDAQCGAIFGATGVAPNGLSTLTVSGLAPGQHKFMCFVHPWMRTIVNVKA